MHEDEDNNGKFPDESPVEVRYPRLKQRNRPTAAPGRGCQERLWSSAGLMNGTYASRCASWPSFATAGPHHAGRPAVTSIIRAASGTIRRPGRAPCQARHPARGGGRAGERGPGDRFTTAVVVCAVAAFAAVVSYSHIYGLGRHHG